MRNKYIWKHLVSVVLKVTSSLLSVKLCIYSNYIFYVHTCFSFSMRQLYMVNIAKEKVNNRTFFSRTMEGSHVTDYKEIIGPNCDCICVKKNSYTDSWATSFYSGHYLLLDSICPRPFKTREWVFLKMDHPPSPIGRNGQVFHERWKCVGQEVCFFIRDLGILNLTAR